MLSCTTLAVEYFKQQLPGVVAIYLFGSRTRPADVHETSDWDFAILLDGTKLEALHWWKMKNELGRLLNTEKVDLVLVNGSNFIIRDTVLREGNVLYCKDDLARLNWELASASLIEEWMPFYLASNQASMDRVKAQLNL